MSDAILESASAVIDALGGPRAVRTMTGRTAQQVWNWKNNNRFAASTYLMMTQALKSKGKRAPATLWGQMDGELEPSMTDRPFGLPE